MATPGKESPKLLAALQHLVKVVYSFETRIDAVVTAVGDMQVTLSELLKLQRERKIFEDKWYGKNPDRPPLKD